MLKSKENATTTDLRAHLFAQIERLNDPKADLKVELEKAKALASIGNVIVNSVKIENDFMRLTGATPPDKSPELTDDTKKQLGNG